MHPHSRFGLTLLLALLAAPVAVRAASFASSASSAGSASVGSVSDSLQGSSNSSSSDDDVAQGDYRVTEVAQAPLRTDFVRVRLHSDELRRGFDLDLPQAVWAAQGLGPGDLVHAEPRAYGYEFAHAGSREAFYLVLNDEWYGELAARPL